MIDTLLRFRRQKPKCGLLLITFVQQAEERDTLAVSTSGGGGDARWREAVNDAVMLKVVRSESLLPSAAAISLRFPPAACLLHRFFFAPITCAASIQANIDRKATAERKRDTRFFDDRDTHGPAVYQGL